MARMKHKRVVRSSKSTNGFFRMLVSMRLVGRFEVRFDQAVLRTKCRNGRGHCGLFRLIPNLVFILMAITRSTMMRNDLRIAHNTPISIHIQSMRLQLQIYPRGENVRGSRSCSFAPSVENLSLMIARAE